MQGIEHEDAQIGLRRCLQPTLLFKNIAEVEQSTKEDRVDLERSASTGLGLCKSADGAETIAQVAVGCCKCRVSVECETIRGDGLVLVAELAKQVAQIIMGGGVDGIEGESLAEADQRALVLTETVEGEA